MTDRRYITKIRDKWCVVQHMYFGYYDTLEEAIRERDLFIQEGKLVPKMPKRDTRHIHMNKAGKYVIRKSIQGKIEHFGTFKTLEDAIDERDYLESIDWDYSNMETVESLEYQENKEKWRRAINE